MIKKTALLLLINLLPALIAPATAALNFSGVSRVIYHGNEKQHNYRLINGGAEKILVQSWLTSIDGGEDVPFALTPTLKEVMPEQPLTLQIILQSARLLPQDRESAFYLHVKEIPAKPAKKADASQIQFALNHRFYLFYRPNSIGANSTENINRIKWRFKSGAQGKLSVEADNPNPFYYSLLNLSVNQNGNKQLIAEHVLLAPYAKTEIAIPLSQKPTGAQIEFSAVSDIGRGLPIQVKQIS